jgi:Penicillin amidase
MREKPIGGNVDPPNFGESVAHRPGGDSLAPPVRRRLLPPVLAFGEGKNTSATDLAAFEANGSVPADDLNQQPLYEGLEQAWPGFSTADLNRYYKDSSFAAQPAAGLLAGTRAPASRQDLPGGLPGGLPGPLPPILGSLPGSLSTIVGSSPSGTESPRSGLTIVRQAPYDVPRIYGATRADAMWGAGFVTAEDRLFFMDVLRHTAEGTTAELLGPSAASADSTQLGLQDASLQQLTDQMASLPKTIGARGRRPSMTSSSTWPASTPSST